MNDRMIVDGFTVGDIVTVSNQFLIGSNLKELSGETGRIDIFTQDNLTQANGAVVVFNTGAKFMIELKYLEIKQEIKPDYMDVNSKRGPISRNDVVKLIRDRAGCGIEEAKLIFKELVKAQEPARKVIQLTTVQVDQIEQNAYTITTALCNDGTMWQCTDYATGNVDKWQEINPIPQPD